MLLPSSVEENVFLFAIVTAVALVRTRYDYIDGNPVPVLIFNNKPALFHAFIVSLNFSFTAAVASMSCPTMARFCRRPAFACAVVAAGLLAYSACLPSLAR